jgi:anti-sigma regulatory factor (Ser/Thr protein kinase)/ActR/RegA family two-component response regulator
MSTILVIDDDPALHHLIESAVADYGFRLLFAPTCEAALGLLKLQHCDLLFLDCDTNGLEPLSLIETLRNTYPELKIILQAAHPTPQTALSALANRVCDLLLPPLSVEDLRTSIVSAVSECRLHDLEVLSAEQNWVQLRVPCDLNIVPILQKLLTILQSDLPEEIREGIAYAFREMLNNAIEHGGKLDPSKYVEILFCRMKRAIVYWIKDPGEGFDPEHLPHAAVSNPDHDPFRHILVRDEQGLRAGGFGILLTHQLVDELVYNERRNELMFIKYI